MHLNLDFLSSLTRLSLDIHVRHPYLGASQRDCPDSPLLLRPGGRHRRGARCRSGRTSAAAAPGAVVVVAAAAVAGGVGVRSSWAIACAERADGLRPQQQQRPGCRRSQSLGGRRSRTVGKNFWVSDLLRMHFSGGSRTSYLASGSAWESPSRRRRRRWRCRPERGGRVRQSE